MSDGPDDQTYDLPQWKGSERFWDARDKHAAGDRWGAFLAYGEVIGPTVREYSDDELPYVASARLAVAAIADEGGDTRDAIAAYNIALGTIERNATRMSRYSFIWGSLSGLR
jgi:hypothetical protein